MRLIVCTVLAGAVSATVFLPYIYFGEWDFNRKRTILIVCLPLLIVGVVLVFFFFYNLKGADVCWWCHYLDCIPYTTDLECD
jgi:hypothetical protein